MLTRLLLVLSVLSLCPIALHAQEAPKAEAFVGYNFTRSGGALGSSSYDKNLNGWDAAATVNLNRWFGIEGDVSGSYGRKRMAVQLPATPLTPAPTLDALLQTHLYTFTGGPRFSIRGSRVTTYGHLLLGAAKVTQYDEGTYSFLPTPGPHVAGTYNQTSFAMLAGGGLDLRVTESIAVRLVQVDYLMTRFDTPRDEHTQNGLRVSTGIVFAF